MRVDKGLTGAVGSLQNYFLANTFETCQHSRRKRANHAIRTSKMLFKRSKPYVGAGVTFCRGDLHNSSCEKNTTTKISFLHSVAGCVCA